MHTKDMLAKELSKIGLDQMSARAAEGYYHDFLSPLDYPELHLLEELKAAVKELPAQASSITRLSQRIMMGDFDASIEESDAWAASEEGRAVFRRLLNGRR